MGILSDLNRKRKRAQDKLKDEFLGFTSSVSRKFVPKELRPALPFLSAAIPFMVPASGIFAGPLGRALLSSGSNLLAQGLSDPEAEDLNLLSAAIAGATGALSSPEVSGSMRAGIDTGTTAREAGIMSQAGRTAVEPSIGFMQGAENIGREGIATLSDVVTGTGETFRKFGKDPGLLFEAGKKGARFPGLKELGGAIAIPAAQGTGDLAFTEATKALREFNATEAAELAQAGADAAAIADARRNAIRYAMEVSGFEEDEIMETFDELGLKDGGRVGLREGGLLQQLTAQNFIPGLGFSGFRPLQQAQAVFPRLNELEQGVNRAEGSLNRIRNRLGEEQRTLAGLASFQPGIGLQPALQPLNMGRLPDLQNQLQELPSGPARGMKDGGMMDLQGKEMDLRGGGFVPIGKKERADDVPARLSKNEFVMTADAVRAAGGGSVNKGAQRMYNLMNNLEARA